MPTKTVFADLENNEMDCYMNDKGRVYMSISQPGEDNIYSGFITLDKTDVQELIAVLTKLEQEMED